MKISIPLLLAAVLLPMGCLAADRNGNYGSSLPKDIKDCNDYIAALDNCLGGHCYKQNLFNAWLNGYITAYNAYVSDTFNIIGDRNPASLNYWLADYCKKNPQDSFDTAVGHLMSELRPQRTKEKPKD
jgi:hypothetical protein